MKKFVAMLLVLCTILSVSAVSLAEAPGLRNTRTNSPKPQLNCVIKTSSVARGNASTGNYILRNDYTVYRAGQKSTATNYVLYAGGVPNYSAIKRVTGK